MNTFDFIYFFQINSLQEVGKLLSEMVWHYFDSLFNEHK